MRFIHSQIYFKILSFLLEFDFESLGFSLFIPDSPNIMDQNQINPEFDFLFYLFSLEL
jgi:hypothetical protein